MKKFYLFLVIILSFPAFAAAQKRKPAPRKPSALQPKKAPASEKGDFEKAVAQTDPTQKIAALQKFTNDFPKSSERTHALELLVSTRARLADEKLRAGETAAGIELFKQAVADAPSPMSEKLFSEVVLQFPTNLFYNRQPQAAIEIAGSIEEKVGSASAKQILGLATFYIGTENGAEAVRLAHKAIALDPQMPAAYQTLGLASRLNFQLDDSVAAYAKAAELDPNSVVSKRSLAEMKRAVGKSAEAAALYREILEKNPDDAAAQTGLALSLFDSEKQAEAETEMSKALEKNPNNLFLLVGAAYWYAAHQDGAKAVDLAAKAVAVEPRYTWAHIAMARGFLLQNRYTDAEKELLLARQYGNFPTLTYELAAVRLAAGFYQEAAQELGKSFAVTDDSVQTNLGNRVSTSGENFIELLAPERRASIFEPVAADSSEAAEKLKSLLALNQKLAAADSTDEEIDRAVNEFVKGDDAAKTHRQLYAANRLLQTQKDLPRVLELTQNAVGGVDAALQMPNAASAVMADELLESRTLAISRGEVVVVPSIPRQTLSAIMRGRIEEIAGWTLFNQNKPEEAVVRLKRAVSVLPEKSAWWRLSMWRLGAAFDASNKPALALDAYVKSYLDSPPEAIKYAVIERVYQKVNGNLEGLDKKIGVKPVDSNVAVMTPAATPASEIAKTDSVPAPSPVIEAAPEISAEATSKVSPERAAQITAAPKNESAPSPELTAPAENKSLEKSAAPTAKPSTAFEPIIIKIPKNDNDRTAKTETQKTSTDTSATEKSNSAPADNSGEARPRVSEVKVSEPDCLLAIDQQNITLSANSGRLGVLVSLPENGDISKVAAASSNPADIEVTIDPDIGRQPNRAFFIIKSVSAKTGIYTVTFDSPCGKKEIQVRVR